MTDEMRDWLFELIWKFQDATAVAAHFTKDADGEMQVERVEPFHPVVDIVMKSPAPDGNGTLSDWYHKELTTRLRIDE